MGSLRAQIGQIHGILVSGDVAFRGDTSEYAEAHTWLTHLSTLVGCELQYIWTVPGNHDVDQTFIEANPMLQIMQDSLSTGTTPEQVDYELNRQLSSRDLDSVIFGPLRQYNQFASKFNCELSCARQFWEHSVKLNDGSELCIRGLNSALVSNKKDHADTHKMVVGQSNCAMPQRNGVTYLAMCHHPPDWLRDGKQASDFLDNRAALQLFGHKHEQTEQHVNEITLRLYSGALHPTASEQPYEPRFNCLSLWATEEHEQRFLNVDLRPMRWTRFKKFQEEQGRKGEYPIVYRIKIGDFTTVDRMAKVNEEKNLDPDQASAKSDPLSVATQSENPAASGKTTSTNAPRRLAYRFHVLPHIQRITVATKLELYSNEDEGIPDSELFKRILRRAYDKRILHLLWAEVEALQKDPELAANPFEQK